MTAWNPKNFPLLPWRHTSRGSTSCCTFRVGWRLLLDSLNRLSSHWIWPPCHSHRLLGFMQANPGKYCSSSTGIWLLRFSVQPTHDFITKVCGFGNECHFFLVPGVHRYLIVAKIGIQKIQHRVFGCPHRSSVWCSRVGMHHWGMLDSCPCSSCIFLTSRSASWPWPHWRAKWNSQSLRWNGYPLTLPRLIVLLDTSFPPSFFSSEQLAWYFCI